MSQRNLLKGFKKPKSLTFEQCTVSPTYGKFVASPFERGFGTTVGNTLRRVLLSSIQGWAASALRISYKTPQGSQHQITSEFEKIPFTVEDTSEIIANFKGLFIQLPEEMETTTVIINFEGSKKEKITGADFEGNSVTILNPEKHLFTLTPDGSVEVEMQIDLGRGYVPAEDHEKNIDIQDTIAIDSLFSPVLKVSYFIEGFRVGQRADYEKLTIEIWTNGAVNPENALAEAAKITKEHFSIFINFNEAVVRGDDEISEDEQLLKNLLNTDVEELELSVRSSNCLKNANIKKIGELIRHTEDEIVKTRNFGKKSLEEIVSKLKERNLSLGMTDNQTIIHALKAQNVKE